ncbi:MAG: substrate-binding domain-containing protein [Kiritimatiellae bacterium]|nr:substrate-binding domain-containing protein [Kiritimatiellia bacterium]
MRTILFITDLHIGAQIKKFAGVFAQARVRGWHVVEIERERTSRPLSEFRETWNPLGAIIDCSGLEKPPSDDLSGFPVVFLDPDPTTISGSCNAVLSDARELAAMAVGELVRARCSSFVFAGWRSRTSWSVARGEAFRELLAERGLACTVADEPWSEELEMHRNLAATLGKVRVGRIGIFAANDYVARHVVAASATANLESPRDAAIVGVDDDELICEALSPTITSIGTNFEKAGRLAVDLLAESLENPGLSGRRVAFGPTVLHRRQSSRVVNTADRRIFHAVERIRLEACDGLKASEVIEETGLSRRIVERRFLEATGRTILQEITEVRFERACALLRDPSVRIGDVAFMCGWESNSYMNRLFKSRTGKTPRQWRNSAI